MSSDSRWSARRSSIALFDVDTPNSSCSHWPFSASEVFRSGMSMLASSAGIESPIMSNIEVCWELRRCASLCASDTMRSNTPNMPERSPKSSKAPALIRLSSAFLPTLPSSAFWHSCSMDWKPSISLRVSMSGVTAASPTFLMADRPKRMAASPCSAVSMEKFTSLLLMLGGRTLMFILRHSATAPATLSVLSL